MEEDDYWFKDLKNVKEDFDEFTFYQMLVLRRCKGKLSMGDYVEKIIIDDPERNFPYRKDTCAYALGALRHAYSLSPNDDLDFEIRKCSKSCGCRSFYNLAKHEILKTLFSPLAG